MDNASLVKDKTDVAEFIRQYVELRPAGKNLKGLCPFHKEKTPSFMVSPERQTWRCFGCDRGGDVIAFLMEYENLEFFESLKVLAERAGVQLAHFGGAQAGQQSKILYEINEAAKGYYTAQLKGGPNPADGGTGGPQFSGSGRSVAAQAAWEYLKKRGLQDTTIEVFEVGFVPNEKDSLNAFLLKQGYTPKDIEKAGFIYKTERGTYWDRFRNRIMFPLMNSFGKTVGFTGRIMPSAEDEKVGKYVNSPETPIFNKSKLLFGLHLTKGDIRESKTAVLVEGQMDVMMVWQDGVKNVTATSGTAITAEHIKGLKRVAETLVVGFDTDDAGLAAAERVIDLASAADLAVNVVSREEVTPDLKDPADIVKAHPGIFVKLVNQAKPAMEYYLDYYLGNGLDDIREKKMRVRTVLAKINAIQSAMERSHWMRQLSMRANVDERDLYAELTSIKPGTVPTSLAGSSSSPRVRARQASQTFTAKVKETRSRYDVVAEQLLALVYGHEDFLEQLAKKIDFFPASYKGVLSAMTEGHEAPEYKEVLDLIALQSGFLTEHTVDAHHEFDALVRELTREYYRLRQAEATCKIRNAEQRKDEEALNEALKEFDMYLKEMNNVS